MTILTNGDWQRLDEFLKSLYAPCDLEYFPVRLMSALLEIIRADTTGITSFSFGEKTLPCIITLPDPSIGVAATAFVAKPENFLSHPVAVNYINTGNGKASAISDFFTVAELHAHEPLYPDFLQLVGIEDQMGIFFELPSQVKTINQIYLWHHKKEHISLIASRDRRNFTDCDRLIFNLIRPHIKQAYDTRVAFHQVHHHLAQQQAATDQAALIALSASGTVQWITRKAGEILHRYFLPSKVPMALPDLLQQWVNRHLAIFSQGEEISKLARPLKFQIEGRRLVVRFSYCPKSEQLYLLLEESDQESFSVESLKVLGLTKREAEVLFWVAKDKSLVEVAQLLGMRERTAKKHLEHIYEKFNVQTRLSAVMYALEHLGIFS